MVKRLALAALALALTSSAEAATSITTKATGAAGTLNVATDGTNLWGPVLIWDGTTWATVNAGDSGLTVHLANTTLPLPTGAAKESGGNLDSLVTLATTLNSYVSSPPPINVNGANVAWSGLTPGTPQTGTVAAADVNIASIAGYAGPPLQYHHYSATTAGGDAINIKNTAGVMYSFDFVNTTTTAAEIKFYDLAAAPTCSSATGVLRNMVIPANTSAPGGGYGWANGISFPSHGVSFCIVAQGAPPSDTDAAATVAGIVINVSYH